MRRAGLCCVLAVALEASIATGSARAAAPPAPPRWVAGEVRKVKQLEARADQAGAKGDFAQALRLSQEALAARKRLQGARHWQTVDAALTVERWTRLARLPPAKQRRASEGFRSNAAGQQNLNKSQFVQAEKSLRDALALFREALGEEHPETAQGCNNLANCLKAAGRPAEALPLYQRALAIRRKVQGEGHPDTARGYNNVALCLNGLGKHKDALVLQKQALAIWRKALGEDHPDTALGCNNLAVCLHGQGKYAEALPLLQQTLAIYRKVLGEDHPDIATCCNNVAACLHTLGRPAEALPLFQQALLIWRKVLGENRPPTATGYHSVASCLQALGRRAEALPLFRQALLIWRKVLGEDHPATATGFHSLASCLQAAGRPAEALPLFHKALAIRRNALGENHPDTADSYAYVASCLEALGKPAEALPLYQRALLINRKVLGEAHPYTAHGYNNVASCLHRQGKHKDALALYEKALAIRLEVLGEQHPDTATSYNNVASCLHDLRRPADALPLFQKALLICRKALGADHPDIARSCNNLGNCLQALGKSPEALLLLTEALAIRKKVLGEEHPDTASSYINVGHCLNALGRRAEAVRHLRRALLGLDWSRQGASARSAAFDRSVFAATQQQGRFLLACYLAGDRKEAGQAWRHAESYLARGLLDTFASSSSNVTENARRAELAGLEARLMPLLIAGKLTPQQQEQRDILLRQGRRLRAEIARADADRLAELVWSYQRVQKHLPADAAVVIWLDMWLDGENEHWGCVLRREGEPRWMPLTGSGKAGAWTRQDVALPSRVHAAVQQPGTDNRRLIDQLRRQRLLPLEKHLKAEGKLPAVRRLIVLPVGLMAALPVEVLAPEYTVSYAPSATLFARGVSRARAVQLSPLLALGDPVFDIEKRTPAAPPEYGLLLTQVLPGGNAARAGLKAGDVLLSYNGVRLRSLSDFKAASEDGLVKANAWRDGETFAVRLRPGPLHVRIDNRPVAKALAAWRDTEALIRGGEAFPRLPGTRFEVEAIARLIGGSSTLLRGSFASEQKIDQLIRASSLQTARVIHLATHGLIDQHWPEHSALVLARDTLPDPVEQSRRGLKVYDGCLRVSTILSDWKLDADLVVLSACETGLGQEGGGEGLMGFTQAFLQKGARSVVLSRWKVDDTATALLMLRFYENLLGKRAELKKPLGRAEALHEAKKWLAGLDRAQALGLAGGLVSGEVRGTVKKLKPPSTRPDKAVKLPDGERPFAHPAFWAAFVLVGEAD